MADSDDSAIDPYLEVIFYRDLIPRLKAPDGVVRPADVRLEIERVLTASLEPYNRAGLADRPDLVNQITKNFINHSAIQATKDRFAGTYFKFSMPHVKNMREAFLQGSQINNTAEFVGKSFFYDVFDGYGASDGAHPADIVSIPVPAADRIVNVQHNQFDDIKSPLDAFIVDLEQDNGIPDELGTKERLLGQVRAGRELITVGTFRAHLLYLTLIRGLGELAIRYKDRALGIAAEQLIKLIVAQFFSSIP